MVSFAKGLIINFSFEVELDVYRIKHEKIFTSINCHNCVTGVGKLLIFIIAAFNAIKIFAIEFLVLKVRLITWIVQSSQNMNLNLYILSY